MQTNPEIPASHGHADDTMQHIMDLAPAFRMLDQAERLRRKVEIFEDKTQFDVVFGPIGVIIHPILNLKTVLYSSMARRLEATSRAYAEIDNEQET